MYIIDGSSYAIHLRLQRPSLKIIEEPPEHLIFILATTELHKVPATILSLLPAFFLPTHFAGGCGPPGCNMWPPQEHISLEPQAAMVLARMADGAPPGRRKPLISAHPPPQVQ